MTRTRLLALITVASMLATACGDGSSSPTSPSTSDPTSTTSTTTEVTTTSTPGEPVLVVSLVNVDRGEAAADTRPAGEAITRFGIDLHGALDAEADAAANLVSSPASVAVALAMLEPGTVGDAQVQLRALLGITDPAVFHESMNALEQSLESRIPQAVGDGDPGEVEIAVANAAYLQRGYPFKQTYLDDIGRHYGPVLNEVDFRPDPDAVAHEINQFVGDATRDRIPDLIPDGVIRPETVLALVNALYMKASWLEPFDEANTADEPFTLLDGSRVEVPMMSGFGTSSAAGDGWVGAAKALTGGLEAQFILPDEGRFDEIEARIGAVFAEYAERKTAPAPLAMPRFETRFAVGLDPALQALGLTAVYREGHLLGIADDDRLVLDKALHETFVAVDETGMEAAAATVLLAYPTSAPPEPPVPVTLDRPFLFRVVDVDSGATLFLGRIVDPLAGS